MAFWCRIKQSQLKNLSNQFRKYYYFQINGHCSVNHYNALHTNSFVGKNPSWGLYNSQFNFGNNVRFFAAPVQPKLKHEEKDKGRPRMNEQISAQYVRLVTEEGHGVVTRHEALQRARRLKLDVVEVQPDGKPPVCKLMDYNKEMYKRQVKDKELMKGKSELSLRKGALKEVRITTKIDKNDLQIKADTVKRLMDRGYRVKCMAMGTEDQDLGVLLSRLSILIEDVSVVESGPRVEAKQAYIVVRHVKFGPLKKGPSKKKAVTTPTTKNTSTQSLQNLDAEESGSENEAEKEASDSDEGLEKNKSTWSVTNEIDDDFDKVFEFKNDVNETRGGHMKSAPETSAFPSNTLLKAENRYKSGSENRYASTRQVTNSSPDVPKMFETQSENRYASTRQMNNSSPDVRNQRSFEPQFQNQGRERQFDLNTRPPPPGGYSSPAPGYGMFSTPKPNNSDTQRQSGPAEVNRYKKGPNLKPPSSNFHGNQMPYGDRGGQGRGGGFPRENSDMNPGSGNGNQGNFQR